ncbi:hypothetical protein DFH07DRAFT_799395 [Mycena maculata]|uniref:Uncharacterized protein n=1 Tax=Mycena maculata TaxID=230809 RepID=A0AAD7NTV4_9AGAR|nr:hypothetical protein DFH07DRAFT_799395 [Mycena maculata]
MSELMGNWLRLVASEPPPSPQAEGATGSTLASSWMNGKFWVWPWGLLYLGVGRQLVCGTVVALGGRCGVRDRSRDVVRGAGFAAGDARGGARLVEGTQVDDSGQTGCSGGEFDERGPGRGLPVDGDLGQGVQSQTVCANSPRQEDRKPARAHALPSRGRRGFWPRDAAGAGCADKVWSTIKHTR